MMKFSKNFERDWQWYCKWKDVFVFSGSPNKEIKQGNTYTAKECFYLHDSQGKLEDCLEPELLQQIFKCKESINFQIKEWAQDRAKGYYPENCRFITKYENILRSLNLSMDDLHFIRGEEFKWESHRGNYKCTDKTLKNILEYKSFNIERLLI